MGKIVFQLFYSVKFVPNLITKHVTVQLHYWGYKKLIKDVIKMLCKILLKYLDYSANSCCFFHLFVTACKVLLPIWRQTCDSKLLGEINYADFSSSSKTAKIYRTKLMLYKESQCL